MRRCVKLMNIWRNENDLVRRAEVIDELNALVRLNDKMRHIKWLDETCLSKLQEMTSKTRQDVINQLKSALKSLNRSAVSACMKALQCSFNGHGGYQKDLNMLVDESVRELDSQFLLLNSQNNLDKVVKLLPQISAKLNFQLEQFHLLGSFAVCII